jgi:creatinine amidohydrolase
MEASASLNDERAARLELLRPHEIRDRLAQRSLVYVPLGTIEWHCEHLPVGLDALTAHGICLKAAARAGGLVYPPLYYGTGGDHGGYPWTVMMPDAHEISALLGHTLQRLDELGVEKIVLFSGHFAREQLAMIERIADEWILAGHKTRVIPLAVNQVEGATLGPDHAGRFETTLLSALWPDRIDIGRLPTTETANAISEADALSRHDPRHPLWGVIGADPRAFRPEDAAPLLETCVSWIAMRTS